MPSFHLVKGRLKVAQGQSRDLLEVSFSGPDAKSVTELPILRMLHEVQIDDEDMGDAGCCLSELEVVGEVEVPVSHEIQRLKRKYGHKAVDAMYPGGRGTPKHIDEAEVPKSAYAPPKPAKEAEAKKG